MTDPLGGEVSFNIDETKVFIVTRQQRLSRVALKFLYAVRGISDPSQSFDYAKLPEVAAAEAQLDETIKWLEELGL